MFQREGIRSEIVRLTSGSLCLITLALFLLSSPSILPLYVSGTIAFGLTQIVIGLMFLGALLTIAGVVSEKSTKWIHVVRGLASLLNLFTLAWAIVFVARGQWGATFATIVVFLGMLNLFALYTTFRVGQFDPGKCSECGYNLQGADTLRCPECGASRCD
ncbi:MAG: hypothetical protein O7G85_17020 [Planctomycetota bacterium]|nr:hypothetical protein [Planctomycetota bacterium]